MIQQTSNRHIESLGTAPARVVDYHIDPAATTHIAAMLRNMYSDPLKAVFREYLSNAVDAHTAAGILDTQAIDLHLPTQGEPWLAIRDYGGGLDSEATVRLLYGFGASGDEKRQSNDYIGGFGIGCKCGFALSEAFSYTIWHAGIKTVWSCFLNDRDEGQAKQVFTGTSSEMAGVEVKVPVSFSYDTQRNVQRVLHEVLTFMPGVFNIFNTGSYKIPTRLQSTFEMPATCKIDSHEHPICYQFFPDWPVNVVPLPAVLVGNAIYEIDINQLGTLPGIESQYSEAGKRILRMLKNLVIRVPIGFVQLAPSREHLQYSGLTKKVLRQALLCFLDTSFQTGLYQAAVAKDTTINMLQRRHRAELMGLDVNEDQSDQHGFLIPRDSVSGCGRYIVSGLSYQNGRITYASALTVSAWKNLSENQYVHRDWLSADNGNKPLIVVSTTSKELTSASSAEELVRKAVSKVVADKGIAPDTVKVVLLGDPKPDRLKWLQDGSLTLVEAKDLPDEDTNLFHRPSARQARSSRTYDPSNSLNTRLLKLRTTPKPGTSNDVNGSWWDKAPIKEVRDHEGQLVYVKLALLGPVVSGEPARVYRTAFNLVTILKKLQAFPAVFAGAQELYGVRITDKKTLARIQKDNGFIEFEDYLRQTLATHINDKLVNAEALLWRLALEDLDWVDQENDNKTNVKRLLDTPEFKNLTIAKTFAGWRNYLRTDSKTDYERAWSSLLFWLPTAKWYLEHPSRTTNRLLSLIRLHPTLTGKGPMLEWFAQVKAGDLEYWASEVRQRNQKRAANPIELALQQLKTQLPMLVYASDIESTLLPREEVPSEDTSQRLRTLILNDKELRLHLASQVAKLEATQNTGN